MAIDEHRIERADAGLVAELQDDLETCLVQPFTHQTGATWWRCQGCEAEWPSPNLDTVHAPTCILSRSATLSARSRLESRVIAAARARNKVDIEDAQISANVADDWPAYLYDQSAIELNAAISALDADLAGKEDA